MNGVRRRWGGWGGLETKPLYEHLICIRHSDDTGYLLFHRNQQP